MSGELIIRNARPEEMARLLEIAIDAYDEVEKLLSPTSWAGLSQTLHNTMREPGEAEVIAAELDGELVGSVLLFPPAANAYGDWVEEANFPTLRLLAVHPTARGHGIGRRLTEECIERSKQAGAKALGLHTGDSMVIALPMYERMGFVRNPSLDFGVGGSELVKAYRLDFG